MRIRASSTRPPLRRCPYRPKRSRLEADRSEMGPYPARGGGLRRRDAHHRAETSMWDSPDSDQIVIDPVRCARLVLDRGGPGCPGGSVELLHVVAAPAVDPRGGAGAHPALRGGWVGVMGSSPDRTRARPTPSAGEGAMRRLRVRLNPHQAASKHEVDPPRAPRLARRRARAWRRRRRASSCAWCRTGPVILASHGDVIREALLTLLGLDA